MKTIQFIKTGNIMRLSDDVAKKAVDDGVAKYVPKKIWKALKSA